MTIGLTELAAFLSAGTAARVAASARRVAAIRLGAGRHVCATLWSSDVAVTCSRLLPDQDSYLLLMDDGHAIVHLAWRDEATGLAGLRLAAPYLLPACPAPHPISGDGWLVSIGIDDRGHPVASLAVPATGPGGAMAPWFLIDREPGGGAQGPGVGQARVLAHAEIARLVGTTAEIPAPVTAKGGDGVSLAPPVAGPQNAEAGQPGGNGWLGVGLQPSALSRAFTAVAGQSSGRKVFDVVPDGPADLAGLRAGDIVLSIANQSMVGDRAVRRFLSGARVGETAEIVALRGGELIRLNITVRQSPAG